MGDPDTVVYPWHQPLKKWSQLKLHYLSYRYL